MRGFLGRSGVGPCAESLYNEIVAQARQPGFYRHLGVPDTALGRFEMISLHAFLVLRRIKAMGARGRELGQQVHDFMFADMDRNLREMGVGDLGVGKRVKMLASNLYGRIDAYDSALMHDDDRLVAALRRNLYATAAPADAQIAAMAAYLRREAEALDGSSDEVIFSGVVRFGAPPGGACERGERT
ncbi:MAG: ubiquinol-cytochrome C chaperone family protein [Alphaproteobacteria bacterium]